MKRRNWLMYNLTTHAPHEDRGDPADWFSYGLVLVGVGALCLALRLWAPSSPADQLTGDSPDRLLNVTALLCNLASLPCLYAGWKGHR